jgi:hypothetical protein
VGLWSVLLVLAELARVTLVVALLVLADHKP